MRCPVHKEVWLYENMLETQGFCPVCQLWYNLPDDKLSIDKYISRKDKR